MRKKPSNVLKSRAVTQRQIDAQLSAETRPWVRKRLIAVRTVLAGHSPATAARTAGASQPGISRWLGQAQRQGWTALLRYNAGPSPACRLRMTPDAIARAWHDIDAALAGHPPPRLRKRLTAVRAVIEGQSLATAAAFAQISYESLRRWIELLRRGGCPALLRDNRTRSTCLLLAALQMTPSGEAHPGPRLPPHAHARLRKRLAAIRAILAGLSNVAAARAAKVHARTIQRWRLQLRRHGPAAFLANPRTNKRPPVPTTPQPVSSLQQEIEAALARDPPPWAHKRLVAVRAVLRGQSLADAARSAHTSPASIRRWLRWLLQHGCAALLREPQQERAYPLRMTPEQIAAARNDIDVALAQQPSPLVRKRLTAVRVAIEGGTLRAAGRATSTSPTSIRQWLDQLRQHGCAALLRGPARSSHEPWMTPQESAAALSQIEAALASEQRPGIRKRQLAVCAVLAGETNAAAARAANASPRSLRRWCRTLRQSGCSALLIQHHIDPGSGARKPRRSCIDAASLPVTQDEIAVALANEQRPWIRKRLVAFAAVIEGQTLTAAARSAGASTTSMWKWLRRLRQSGCAGLIQDGRVARVRPPLMTTQQIAAARQSIEVALTRPLGRSQRQRLIAIQLALQGQLQDAAARAGVRPVTVSSWLRQIRRHGLTQFLAQCPGRPSDFEADLAQLNALATAEKNPNVRKRILALAYVAAGVPVYDAAITARLTPETVYTTIRRFRREGAAAFRNKPVIGRRVKLAPDQVEAVAAIVRTAPDITPEQLCARVEADFAVRYTPTGIKNMLKNQLGIAYRHPEPRA